VEVAASNDLPDVVQVVVVGHFDHVQVGVVAELELPGALLMVVLARSTACIEPRSQFA